MTAKFAVVLIRLYGIRKDMVLYNNGSGPMEIDLVSLKDREQIGGLSNIRLAASHKNNGEDFPASYINEIGNFKVIQDADRRLRTAHNQSAVHTSRIFTSLLRFRTAHYHHLNHRES